MSEDRWRFTPGQIANVTAGAYEQYFVLRSVRFKKAVDLMDYARSRNAAEGKAVPVDGIVDLLIRDGAAEEIEVREIYLDDLRDEVKGR